MTDVPAVFMPDFWAHEAALWFRILKPQFSYLQITKNSTIFPSVTPYISKHVKVQVSDILITASAEAPSYDDFTQRRQAATPTAGSCSVINKPSCPVFIMTCGCPKTKQASWYEKNSKELTGLMQYCLHCVTNITTISIVTPKHFRNRAFAQVRNLGDITQYLYIYIY